MTPLEKNGAPAEKHGDAAQMRAEIEAPQNEMVQGLDGEDGGALESSGDEDDDADLDDFLGAIFDQRASLEDDMVARTALLANVPRRIVAKLAEIRDLSEYEVDRAINMAANRVHLHSVGIEPIAPKAPVTARAKGKEHAVVPVAPHRLHSLRSSHTDGLPLTTLGEGRFTRVQDPVRHTCSHHAVQHCKSHLHSVHTMLAGRGRSFRCFWSCVLGRGLGGGGHLRAATDRIDGGCRMVCEARRT